MSGRLWNPRASAREHCEIHLSRVCDAVGSPDTELLLGASKTLTRFWTDRAIEDLRFEATPEGHDSLYVIADGSPMEISVKTSRKGPVVRFTASVALDRPAQRPVIGRALLDEIERTHEADASSVRRALEAVTRTGERGGDVWMYGVEPAGGRPCFKAYLSSPAWRAVLDTFGISQVPPVHEDIRMVSVDLTDKPSRVKLYWRVRPPKLKNVLKLVGMAPEFAPEEAEAMLAELTGSNRDRLEDAVSAAGPIDATIYVSADPAVPPRLALALNTWSFGEKAVSDEELSQRMVRLYQRFNLDPNPYVAALRAIARTDLRREYMITSYCTLQFPGGSPSLTAYLSPRLFAYSAASANFMR